MKLTEINIRDPFILKFNEKYYMYGSRVGVQTGFDVYESRDLLNWSNPKSVFEITSDLLGHLRFTTITASFICLLLSRQKTPVAARIFL